MQVTRNGIRNNICKHVISNLIGLKYSVVISVLSNTKYKKGQETSKIVCKEKIKNMTAYVGIFFCVRKWQTATHKSNIFCKGVIFRSF